MDGFLLQGEKFLGWMVFCCRVRGFLVNPAGMLQGGEVFWGELVFCLDSVSQMYCLQNHLKKYIIVHVQIVVIYLAEL